MSNRNIWVSIIAGILAGVMLLGLIASILPAASAASSSEIQKQIDSMKKEQKEMEDQLKKLKKEYKTNTKDIKEMLVQKAMLEQEANILHLQVDNLTEQITAYSLLIADKQVLLDETEEHLEQLHQQNRERIRAMEENGTISYWSVLFNANSFSDFLDRLNMVQEIAASDKRHLDEMRQIAEEVAQARENLIAEKQELEVSRADLTAKQEELEAKEQEAREKLNELLARGDEFEDLMEQQEEELSRLEEELAGKDKELQDQKEIEYWEAYWATYVPPTTAPPPTTVPPTTVPVTKPSTGGEGGTPVKNDNITWLVPCSYIRVSSGFGWRHHPISGEYGFHSGVDLATPCPNKIYATRAGVVVKSQYHYSAGNYVVIDHGDGYKSTYMHMCKTPYVKVGDVVAQGEVIGCIGTTGSSTGNHLHFAISYNGEYVNPMDYIKK